MTTKHGHATKGISPTYCSWAGMKARCSNPKHVSYPRYGAIGIAVCERWKIFVNFLADMGERPLGTSLDRFPDKNGSYEPGNCRWATDKQQSQNREKRFTIVPQGQLLLAQFLRPIMADSRIAEKLGLWRGTLVKQLGARDFRVRAA